MREWLVGNHGDLYTSGLSELMQRDSDMDGGGYHHAHACDWRRPQPVHHKPSQPHHNTPGTIYIIAVPGPYNATESWFVNNWYTSLKNAVLDKPVSTTADKARIRWLPDFNLLRPSNVSAALRGTFALLKKGRYGPSHPPPRPASSSSSSSGSSFGNKGTLSAGLFRPEPAQERLFDQNIYFWFWQESCRAYRQEALRGCVFFVVRILLRSLDDFETVRTF